MELDYRTHNEGGAEGGGFLGGDDVTTKLSIQALAQYATSRGPKGPASRSWLPTEAGGRNAGMQKPVRLPLVQVGLFAVQADVEPRTLFGV
jgi:hypothetical protein